MCNASGCESLKCPNDSDILNGSECLPEPCQYYSETNTGPLNAPCVCESEINNEPFICPVNYYCFDDSYTQKGCKPLPDECGNSNEPLNASCICTQDERNNGLFICPKGNYCLENGCKALNSDNKCSEGKVDSGIKNQWF